jgi:hypothetical protein
LAPRPGVVQFPGRGEPLRRQLLSRSRRLLGRWGSRRSTPARGRSSQRWSRRSSRTSSPWRLGTVGTSLGPAPRRSRGWQLAGRAVGRLVIGGSAGVPNGRNMAARANLARRRVDVGGGDVRRRSAAQTEGESRPQDRAFPRRSGRRLAGGHVALRGDTRSMSALHPRLSRALARASAAPRGPQHS